MIIQPPLFTTVVSEWQKPSSFPCLANDSTLSIDVETYDPDLLTKGPGGVTGNGRLVGIAVATDSFSGYFPVGHENGFNFDKATVLDWIGRELRRDRQPKVGANILYDMEWLASSGVDLKGTGQWIDVQSAEALIDEEKDKAFEGGYSLDACALKYLGRKKNETLLKQIAAEYSCGDNVKGNIWRFPSKYVGPYSESDAKDTLSVWRCQQPLLASMSLDSVMALEIELTWILHKMRMQGVRVDIPQAELAYEKLRVAKKEVALNYPGLNEYSGADIARYCNDNSIYFPRTGKGNPSFTKEWLKSQDVPFFRDIVTLREIDRLRETFVKGTILECGKSGRIFCNYRPTISDEGGTRTGRFSCDTPNLQQIPARSDLSHIIRRCFLPEDGEKWAMLDYSQQEPRLLVHYAYGQRYEGAQGAAEAYRNNPNTDFHQMVADLAGVTRTTAKTMNLALMYGMGIAKLADMLGISVESAKDLRYKYFSRVPFVSELAYDVGRRAAHRGYIVTLSGRRRRFDSWELCDKNRNPVGKSVFPVKYEHRAKEEWGNVPIKRANTHKSLNALIQGGSADMIKRAIIDLYNLYGTIPLLTVHDELGLSVANPERGHEAKAAMEAVYSLSVPIVADLKMGENWDLK